MEYEGGGEESRSNPWLAELQQDMFVEINTVDANNLGGRDGSMVWVVGPGEKAGRVKVMAMVTERVAKGTNIRKEPIRTSSVKRRIRRRPTATTVSPRCRKQRPRSAALSGHRSREDQYNGKNEVPLRR